MGNESRNNRSKSFITNSFGYNKFYFIPYYVRTKNKFNQFYIFLHISNIYSIFILYSPPPISNKIANLKPIMFLSSISLEIYLIHPIIMRMISFMDDNYMSYIIFTMIFSTISAFFIKKISTKNIIKFKPIKLQWKKYCF